MGYSTAVTNRTISSYFNVADWTRIYRNGQLAISLTEYNQSTTISYPTQVDKTTANIPDVADFNGVLVGLEAMRLLVVSLIPSLSGTGIKDDWVEGVSNPVFDYSDVNLWETVIDAVWSYYSGSSYSVCPTLTGNLTVTTGNDDVYIDCIDIATYTVDLQGTAHLYVF